MRATCRDLHKLRGQPQISAWRKVRAELASHVHDCNYWVRCCGRSLGSVFEEYDEMIQEDMYHKLDDVPSSDYDENGCCCADEDDCICRPPPLPSEKWLAACPALAWANMRVAAISRPSLGMLLGPG